RHDEGGLAIDRVLAAAAVVGRDQRRPAPEGLEPGLAEALEPAADREHARRRVLAAERVLLEVLAGVPRARHAEEGRSLDDRVGALPRPLLLAAAQQRVALRAGSGPEHVAVDAPELHGRAVAGLGVDLVGGPGGVGELEVDRRPRRLPAALLVVEEAVVQG